ncbi:MAG TPA: crosslink repair DNA glycosylase YcaQ family protein, partial [Cytophagaceae bacterium]|nr:crosslink repair DNA glycosylase YcaQ family protein [Cytophagaceae bacterium]
RIYFSSHAPATLKDFCWWSGLSMTEARHAHEQVKQDFVSEKIGEEIYWMPSSLKEQTKTSVHFLPAFDEFIISYKDRSACIASEHQAIAFTSNGIFRPVFLIDGQGAGIWNRTTKKDIVQIEATYFKKTPNPSKQLLETEALSYGRFLSKKVEFYHV